MDHTGDQSRDGWAAVILAGGTAVRLDGADKASLEYDGSTLLEHTLTAVAEAVEVVVVGEEVPTSRPVTFRREDPPFGGPAAGLLAVSLLAYFVLRPMQRVGLRSVVVLALLAAAVAFLVPRVGETFFPSFLRLSARHAASAAFLYAQGLRART